MASIQAAEDEVREVLAAQSGAVDIAGLNGPRQRPNQATERYDRERADKNRTTAHFVGEYADRDNQEDCNRFNHNNEIARKHTLLRSRHAQVFVQQVRGDNTGCRDKNDHGHGAEEQ